MSPRDDPKDIKILLFHVEKPPQRLYHNCADASFPNQRCRGHFGGNCCTDCRQSLRLSVRNMKPFLTFFIHHNENKKYTFLFVRVVNLIIFFCMVIRAPFDLAILFLTATTLIVAKTWSEPPLNQSSDSAFLQTGWKTLLHGMNYDKSYQKLD